MERSTKEKTDNTSMPCSTERKGICIVLRPFFCLMAACSRVMDHFLFYEKKYFSLFTVMLFFVLGSSFAFPVFTYTEQLRQTEGEQPSGGPVFLARREQAFAASAGDAVQAADPALPDEADIPDGYADSGLEHREDIDKYTLDEILEENGQKEGPGAQTAQLPAEDFVFDKNDWRLLLINKQHPIPKDYTFTLGTIKGSMKCDERIIDDLLDMLQAARDDGISLVICSPYRDLNRQKVLFAGKVKAYMGKGMSYIDAYKISSQAVTVPGASEHQVGLALDIVCTTYYSLNEGFSETEAGIWLQEHSHEYGFTLRYPKGKEYITGIEYEPWHFRYVGKEAAAKMKEKGICLEEFIDSL